MAHKGRVGGRSYIAQKSRNSIAVVWAMLMGGVNKGMIGSCTHTNKWKHILCRPNRGVNRWVNQGGDVSLLRGLTLSSIRTPAEFLHSFACFFRRCSFGGPGCCSCHLRVCRCRGCCSLYVCVCVCVCVTCWFLYPRTSPLRCSTSWRGGYRSYISISISIYTNVQYVYIYIYIYIYILAYIHTHTHMYK